MTGKALGGLVALGIAGWLIWKRPWGVKPKAEFVLTWDEVLTNIPPHYQSSRTFEVGSTHTAHLHLTNLMGVPIAFDSVYIGLPEFSPFSPIWYGFGVWPSSEHPPSELTFEVGETKVVDLEVTMSDIAGAYNVVGALTYEDKPFYQAVVGSVVLTS